MYPIVSGSTDSVHGDRLVSRPAPKTIANVSGDTPAGKHSTSHQSPHPTKKTWQRKLRVRFALTIPSGLHMMSLSPTSFDSARLKGCSYGQAKEQKGTAATAQQRELL